MDRLAAFILLPVDVAWDRPSRVDAAIFNLGVARATTFRSLAATTTARPVAFAPAPATRTSTSARPTSATGAPPTRVLADAGACTWRIHWEVRVSTLAGWRTTNVPGRIWPIFERIRAWV